MLKNPKSKYYKIQNKFLSTAEIYLVVFVVFEIWICVYENTGY